MDTLMPIVVQHDDGDGSRLIAGLKMDSRRDYYVQWREKRNSIIIIIEVEIRFDPIANWKLSRSPYSSPEHLISIPRSSFLSRYTNGGLSNTIWYCYKRIKIFRPFGYLLNSTHFPEIFQFSSTAFTWLEYVSWKRCNNTLLAYSLNQFTLPPDLMINPQYFTNDNELIDSWTRPQSRLCFIHLN